MKQIIIILLLFPLFLNAQNSFEHSYPQQDSFKDTICVIVLLHHLNDFEPNNSVTTERAFMEREGENVQYNMSEDLKLIYKKGYMKIPEKTKLFRYSEYYDLCTKTWIETEVVIDKKNVLQIIEVK